MWDDMWDEMKNFKIIRRNQNLVVILQEEESSIPSLVQTSFINQFNNVEINYRG